MVVSQLLNHNAEGGLSKTFKRRQSKSCGSSHVVQARKAAPLSTPPGVPVVLLLVL